MILLWTTSDSEMIYSYAKAYNAKKGSMYAFGVYIDSRVFNWYINSLIYSFAKSWSTKKVQS